VLRAINAVNGIRDAVYLDTNAWSSLAKHEIDPEPLVQWVERNCCYVWLARMQLAELSARREVLKAWRMSLAFWGVLLIDYGQNDFWKTVESRPNRSPSIHPPQYTRAQGGVYQRVRTASARTSARATFEATGPRLALAGRISRSHSGQ